MPRSKQTPSHVQRFLEWQVLKTRPRGGECSVKANPLLKHSTQRQAVARVCKPAGRQLGHALLCEQCLRYVRAAHWLRDRGLDVSETRVAAVARLLAGEVSMHKLSLRGYHRQLVFFQLKKLVELEHATCRVIAPEYEGESADKVFALKGGGRRGGRRTS